MASSHYAVLQDEGHTQEGQELCLQRWDLHTFWGIGNGHGAVVADPGQEAPAGGEADPMHPAASVTATKGWHQLTKRHLAAPGCTGWLLIHFFNVGRKHSAFEITGSCCQQDIVGMPIQAEDCGVNGFFNVLAYPPVIFGLEITNRNESCSTAHSKFVL